MKRGDPFTATGMVCNFNRAEFESEYGKIEFGKSSLHEFENKPAVVVGAHKAAQLQQPQTSTVERETPSSVTEPTPQTEPAPQSATPSAQAAQNTALPSTASPLPLIAFVGAFALIAGFTVPLLRRQ